MGFYKLLDVMATCNEAWVVIGIVNCFCKCRRSRIFPWIAVALMVTWTYLLTWATNLGEYKMIFIFLFNVLVFWWCYKESLMKMMISVMLAMINLILAEPLAFLAAELVLDRTEVMVDGTLLVYWPIYFVVMAFRSALCVLIRRFFSDFVFEPDIRDLIPVMFDFILVQIIQVIYYDQFFAGNMGATSKSMEFLFAVTNIGFIVHFLYTKKYHTIKSQKEKDEFMIGQMKMQYAYYQDKQQEEERVRSIYHDLKNHLLLLEGQWGQTGKTQPMLDSLKDEISQYENYNHTGNDFLDIIIHDKIRAARENHIDLSVALDFKDGAFMEPLDISSIFGNALDNAIEASMKLPPDQRLVTVKAGRVRDMLSILVENNKAPGQESPKEPERIRTSLARRPKRSLARPTDKADGFLHGFGLANIQKSVEKYSGECVSYDENERFVIKIIIPIPQ